MNDRGFRELERRLDALEATYVRVRTGEVVSTSPLVIDTGADTNITARKGIDGTIPGVGDQVAMLVWRGDAIVLGEIA